MGGGVSDGKQLPTHLLSPGSSLLGLGLSNWFEMRGWGTSYLIQSSCLFRKKSSFVIAAVKYQDDDLSRARRIWDVTQRGVKIIACMSEKAGTKLHSLFYY